MTQNDVEELVIRAKAELNYGDACVTLAQGVLGLVSELAAWGEAHRWIPVKERMPTEKGTYWACYEGEVVEAYFDKKHFWATWVEIRIIVTHWKSVCPRPTPPEVKHDTD